MQISVLTAAGRTPCSCVIFCKTIIKVIVLNHIQFLFNCSEKGTEKLSGPLSHPRDILPHL